MATCFTVIGRMCILHRKAIRNGKPAISVSQPNLAKRLAHYAKGHEGFEFNSEDVICKYCNAKVYTYYRKTGLKAEHGTVDSQDFTEHIFSEEFEFENELQQQIPLEPNSPHGSLTSSSRSKGCITHAEYLKHVHCIPKTGVLLPEWSDLNREELSKIAAI